MAPSATESTLDVSQNVKLGSEPTTHVHGGEEQTPCEAISHGDVIIGGILILLFKSIQAL